MSKLFEVKEKLAIAAAFTTVAATTADAQETQNKVRDNTNTTILNAPLISPYEMLGYPWDEAAYNFGTYVLDMAKEACQKNDGKAEIKDLGTIRVCDDNVYLTEKVNGRYIKKRPSFGVHKNVFYGGTSYLIDLNYGNTQEAYWENFCVKSSQSEAEGSLRMDANAALKAAKEAMLKIGTALENAGYGTKGLTEAYAKVAKGKIGTVTDYTSKEAMELFIKSEGKDGTDPLDIVKYGARNLSEEKLIKFKQAKQLVGNNVNLYARLAEKASHNPDPKVQEEAEHNYQLAKKESKTADLSSYFARSK